MSHTKRVLALLFALFAIGGLAACGNSSDSSTGGGGGKSSTPATTAEGENRNPSATTIVLEDGQPVGGVQELEYSAGEQVRFTVESDVADEVHVHGYDLTEDVPAGGRVTFSFPAEIEGIFEVELEGQGEQIAELRVNP
jgi:hypothetical protein